MPADRGIHVAGQEDNAISIYSITLWSQIVSSSSCSYIWGVDRTNVIYSLCIRMYRLQQNDFVYLVLNCCMYFNK